MATSLDDLIPSAADNMKKIALAEAEKASAHLRKQEVEAAEKKALLERFEKPSGVSDEERLKRAAAIIKRAVIMDLLKCLLFVFQTNFARIAVGPSTSRSLAGKTP